MSVNLILQPDVVKLSSNDNKVLLQKQSHDLVAVGIAGPVGPTGAGGALGYYGAFSDYTTQTPVADTATPMLLGTTDEANGVSIASGSRITFAHAGTYNVQWSGQFVNSATADCDVSVWFRKNGIDVPGSTGIVNVPSKHGSSSGHALPSWNFVLTVAANDYVQFYWSSPLTTVSITTFPISGSPTRPTTASLVVTATQVMYAQTGPQGVTGPQGAQGVTGAQGVAGAQGSQGPQGLVGPQGAQGVAGAQGDQGAQGPQGVAGAQGSQGPQGVAGAQGSQGVAGAQGAQGAQGSQGVAGDQGPQGAQGAQGSQGVAGAQGAQGAQGNQGVNPTSDDDQLILSYQVFS